MTRENSNMTANPEDKGRCETCGSVISRRQMLRHLAGCAYPEKGATVPVLQLRVEAGAFWLDLDIKTNARLTRLDEFLRAIWLECCGHLSAFTIDGTCYATLLDEDPGLSALNERSMDVAAGEALPSDSSTFLYEYDYGSTTELRLMVVDARKAPKRREAIRLLARNQAPVFECEICGAPATEVCAFCFEVDEAGLVCEAHVDDHDCGEEATLPVVNSPRMGICAYTGEP
jgi:hypothetical protein